MAPQHAIGLSGQTAAGSDRRDRDGRPDFSRTLIVGNSGAGKSWLAGRLCDTLGCRAVDLDTVHWEPGGYDAARDRALALAMVREAAAGPAWVIEGVFGWLAEAAVPAATILLWLDLPVDDCIANLRRRGLRRGGDETSFAALVAWATDYPNRRTSSSFSGHGKLFAAFPRHKLRLSSREAMDVMLASVQLPQTRLR